MPCSWMRKNTHWEDLFFLGIRLPWLLNQLHNRNTLLQGSWCPRIFGKYNFWSPCTRVLYPWAHPCFHCWFFLYCTDVLTCLFSHHAASGRHQHCTAAQFLFLYFPQTQTLPPFSESGIVKKCTFWQSPH